MGLVPEYFIMLGIDIFLAMSLLSAVLDDDLPSRFQYLFPVAAIVGVGQILISQGFINSGVFGRDPTDLGRFWVSVGYLAFALSSVVGVNVYFAAVRRKITLASVFSGTVTVPTLMTSAIFVSSFLGNGGEVSFTPASIMMMAVVAAVVSVSMFGFLRQASRYVISRGRVASLTGPTPAVSQVAGGPVSEPPGAPAIGLPLHPSSAGGEEWEESPRK